MEIPWHEYTRKDETVPVTQACLSEKSSVVGRTGMMLLSCGTGAWRVRSSMNALSESLGITCTADIGLLSISYTCFDGTDSFSQSLCLTTTGVNTSRLNRLERFVSDFATEGSRMTGEELHSHLDQIEQTHGLYSPVALGFASALACGAFTFLLGGGPLEMILAFIGAGIGNGLRSKLTKHHYTLFLCIAASVASACLVYAGSLKAAELLFHISSRHEAGYICSMLFIIPGFPFITSGIDLAKLEFRTGTVYLLYHYCGSCNHCSVAHGTASQSEAGRFPKTESDPLCASSSPPCGRFLRCIWILCYVQQSYFPGCYSGSDRFHLQYSSTGACGSFRFSTGCSGFSWSTVCRASGFPYQKQDWFPQNLRYSSFYCDHGTWTVPV